MPHYTERSIYLEDLAKINMKRVTFKEYRRSLDVEDQDEDDLDDFLEFMYRLIKSKKYIFPRKAYRKGLISFDEDLAMSPKSNDDNKLIYARPWLSEMEFRQKYRMTRHSFDHLLQLIKDHPVFSTSKNKGRKQAVPEYQLMCLLKYLGTEGNGAGGLGLRSLFKIGCGTGSLYTTCAMTAVRSLRDKVVFWPDEAEQQEIANRVRRDSCFPNCVGFIDGTLFPLSKCILKYIDVCIILHNLLIKQKDPVLQEWLDQNDLMDPLEDDFTELNKAIPANSKKDTRRSQLKAYINEHYVP
jgi:hypothetical protein